MSVIRTPQAESEDRAAWEANNTHAGYSIACLRVVFDQYHAPDDWKAPVHARVPVDDLNAFREAVVFFQGDRPLVRWDTLDRTTETVLVVGRGYQG